MSPANSPDSDSTQAARVACPTCLKHAPKTAAFVIFCAHCGHRWLNRSDVDHRAVERSTFTHDYSGYRADATYAEAVARILRAELVPRVAPPGRLLDVGCGAGDLMLAAEQLGYSGEGLDISQASADICVERGLNARAGDFLTADFPNRFDLITMWDVIAHLREPAAFLERARVMLSERGMLFIKTPAFGDLSVHLANSFPKLAGTLLGAPSHCQYFDKSSLASLLAKSGFEPSWLRGASARSALHGGSLKRRLGRRGRRLVSAMSGDGNLYVVARPTP